MVYRPRSTWSPPKLQALSVNYLNLTSDFPHSMGMISHWTFSFVWTVIVYNTRSILLDVLSVNCRCAAL